jgi:tRNA wybutosine-synthesizing protein 4
MKNGQVIIMGGGATCFSMGTYWNKGIYTIHPWNYDTQAVRPSVGPEWDYWQTVTITPGNKGVEDGTAEGEPPKCAGIPRVTLESTEAFEKVLRNGRPVVLDGLQLGPCVTNWNLEYIVEKLGGDRKVVLGPRNAASIN